MNTKATILLGALLSAGTLLAQAPDTNQAPSTNAPQTQANSSQRTVDPARQAAHLGKQLGLNSDQVSQITPILADRQQQLQTLRMDTSLTPRVRRSKAKSILQDSKSKIEAVMNDTQKQQYEQMIADRRGHRNRHSQA